MLLHLFGTYDCLVSSEVRHLGQNFKSRYFVAMAKLCSIAIIALLAFASLGPANWQIRPMIGWKTEHFLSYFAASLIVCVAWPRPLRVGVSLAFIAVLLEALQGLTPDRVPDLPTALSGAAGAALASLSVAMIIWTRARRGALSKRD